LGFFHTGAIYCFLAVDEQLSSSTYDDLVKGNNLLLNVLFNGGEQYLDVMGFINCGKKTTFDANVTTTCSNIGNYNSNSFTDFYTWFGDLIGDFVIRFIYR